MQLGHKLGLLRLRHPHLIILHSFQSQGLFWHGEHFNFAYHTARKINHIVVERGRIKTVLWCDVQLFAQVFLNCVETFLVGRLEKLVGFIIDHHFQLREI